MADEPKPEAPPAPKKHAALHPRYIAHQAFHLPDGKRFNRGDALDGEDAEAYEHAVAVGESDINFATPQPH